MYLYIHYSDEAVSFANQRGIISARSQGRPFKHNDMEDLERLLKLQVKFDQDVRNYLSIIFHHNR